MEHERQITAERLAAFSEQLRRETAAGTEENYLRHVRAFAAWLDGEPVTREGAAAWKESLLEAGYSPVTVNAMVAAVNKFFSLCGWTDCRVKALRLQRRLFREEGRELTRREYDRLLAAARRSGKGRLELLMEAICATGIRVSEVKYLTVEAARAGRTEINLKGKVRTILIPGKLRKKLLGYAKEKKIASGEIFSHQRRKGTEPQADLGGDEGAVQGGGVSPSKVFPHNLRHLFARTFYQVCPGRGEAGRRAGPQLH